MMSRGRFYAHGLSSPVTPTAACPRVWTMLVYAHAESQSGITQSVGVSLLLPASSRERLPNMTGTSATPDIDDCAYALTLLPDSILIIEGDDAYVVKISEDWYCVVAPDDGVDRRWAYETVPAAWLITSQETVGAALLLHFTRST